MFCTRCGISLEDSAKFCSQCGAPVASNAYSTSPAYPKLSRPRDNRKIAGVCAGVAEYFDLDVTLVRVLWLLVSFMTGIGLLAYPVAWIVMPEEPFSLPAPAPTAQQVTNP